MKKPYVAIVDDDAGFAQYLRTFLSLRGYEARCYTRGDELLASMKQSEAPDVVLLDVMMPGLDGMATLRALKASRPEAQVIMLSGRNQASTIVEAMQAGATDYVVKPDDPEGLGEIALDVAIKNAIEKNRLVSELSELRQQLTDNEDQAVWGTSDGMRRVSTVIEQVGDSDVAVLIRGESGVGKELVSRSIHQNSTRRNRPFVKVNCAALPADLLESELFGHEKGAFTGASQRKSGKFELAHRGTLFLDEIGDLPLSLQPKILRALEEKTFERVGGTTPLHVDVRVVAATNRNLKAAVAARQYREDLYFRLSVFPIVIPPLRDRPSDIPTLARFFIDKFCRDLNKRPLVLSPAAEEDLVSYAWPGNVRELQNCIERAAILTEGDTIHPRHLNLSFRGPSLAAPVEEDGGPWSKIDLSGSLAEASRRTLIQVERRKIEQALKEAGGNHGRAAEVLQVSYKTFTSKLREHGFE